MKTNKARLVSWNELEIISQSDSNCFGFFVDNKNVKLTKKENNIYSFEYNEEILGHKLIVKIGNEDIIVSTLDCPSFIDFDKKYAYLENDLGSTYQKTFTMFKLWAPLCEQVYLRINDSNFEMTRRNRGVFELKLMGDYDGDLYDFVIVRDGKHIVVTDPYGKSSNANLNKSAVINFRKIKMAMNSNCLSNFKNYVDAIIYEGHVRDLTIDKNTSIQNKGKYLGLIEAGRVSKGKNPVGLDYLKSLGITHLQLLPVLDYGSVDETKENEYNWGYDPVSFFTLEGSYSSNPNDPYSRLIEFKKLVSTLHANNIRVNLDVVYNHVYKINEFSLNKITPNYFFRFENGKLSDRSWCGNDFASERVMARKIILDSLLYLLKEFDVDGFRFDLMGLIDLDTMNLISKEVHKIKKNAMIYGEGWDMFATSPYCEKFAHQKNALLTKGIAFFNDSYRNIMRGLGNKSTLEENGFLLGNNAFTDGFSFAYRASTQDIVFPHLFNSYNQSVNYVECHDNATIFDVISDSTNFDEKLRLVKLFNKVLLLSPGIPFIHMGQEFGQSKKSHSNTYNSGDEFNKFNPDLMDERIDLVKSFRNYIKIRKSIKLFSIANQTLLNSKISINSYLNAIDITMKDNKIFHILINKDENYCQLSDLKYKEMELYYPNRRYSSGEHITAYDLGLSPHKCSIFHVLN